MENDLYEYILDNDPELRNRIEYLKREHLVKFREYKRKYQEKKRLKRGKLYCQICKKELPTPKRVYCSRVCYLIQNTQRTRENYRMKKAKRLKKVIKA